jgi:hypothetical protein
VSVSLDEIEAVYRRRGADFFRFALARTGDPEAARDARLSPSEHSEAHDFKAGPTTSA